MTFDFIPYPLWRRTVPAGIAPFYRAAAHLLTRSTQPLDQPHNLTPARLADYLTRWEMLPPGMSAIWALSACQASFASASATWSEASRSRTKA